MMLVSPRVYWSLGTGTKSFWRGQMALSAVLLLISCISFVNVSFAEEAPKAALKFSSSEKDWMSAHPEIRLAVA